MNKYQILGVVAVFIAVTYMITYVHVGDVRESKEEYMQTVYQNGLRDGADLKFDTLTKVYMWDAYVRGAEKWGCETPGVPLGFGMYMVGVREGVNTVYTLMAIVSLDNYRQEGMRKATSCGLDSDLFLPFLENETSFFKGVEHAK